MASPLKPCSYPGWENSGGTKREMEWAKMCGVTIYFDAEELVREMGE